MSGAPLSPLTAIAPTLPQGAAARLEVVGTAVDLRTRAVVAAVVGTPRFGREGEVLAGVAAARDAHADLVDVSLGPRLLGPAAAARILPVVARADAADAARAAAAAGAAVVLVPPVLATELAAAGPGATVAAAPTVGSAGSTATGAPGGREVGGPSDSGPAAAGPAGGDGRPAVGRPAGGGAATGAPAAGAVITAGGGRSVALAVVVDDVRDIAAARLVADQLGVPIALDVSRRTGTDALAAESAGIIAGCRLVRTGDVKRTRRVVEVVATLLEARRAR
ncbi:MAG TPA: hypothetical protein VK306_01020 [Acidimicrobiales bacterium]|nr:hypothetical protein [Acidimicrobiales bacterium]